MGAIMEEIESALNDITFFVNGSKVGKSHYNYYLYYNY